MWAKMTASIMGDDFYILFCAIVATVVLVVSVLTARTVGRYEAEWDRDRRPEFPRYLYRGLSVSYSLLVSLASIFPLLGMFGTVRGLLGIELVVENLDSIKANFFGALTSTAWGIVFAIAFKLLHALFRDYIEHGLEASARMAGTDRSRTRSGAGR